jgi:DNA-binding NarL/FixJ family response regulator
MDDAQFDIFIAAPRGRLRDSLLTLLEGASRIRVCGIADSVSGVLGLISGSAANFILLDSDLHNEAAWTLLGYLKSARPDLRCLFLATDFREHARARKLGADMVLIKGFRIDELYALFSRILPLDAKEPVVFRLPAHNQEEHA